METLKSWFLKTIIILVSSSPFHLKLVESSSQETHPRLTNSRLLDYLVLDMI